MRSSSGPGPRFGALTIVCTALSAQAEEGWVHRLVTHTTHPVELGVKYELRMKAAVEVASRKKT